jgi:signal transduction histidine kinase
VQQASGTQSTRGWIPRSAADAATFVVSAALVVVIISLAVLLVNREDVSRAANDARIAILAEGTLSAAASVENASSQTVLAVTLASSGAQAEEDIVAAAVGALDRTSDELTRRFDVLVSELTPSEQAAAAEALARFNAETQVFVATSINGNVEAATAAFLDSAAAYDELVAEFVDVRDNHVQSVLLAGQDLGRVADAVRFMVFFLVPLMLIIVYRRGARRRDDARHLEEALASERALAQSRDDFIADLSHELRTPLTGIYGFALALGDSSSLSDDDREYAKHIISEAAELNRMVDDLITTGRIAAGTLAMSTEDLRLEPVVTEVAAVFAMRGIPVVVRVPDVIVRADRMGLRQLVLNLVSNAAQHGGDEISVEAVMREGFVSMRVIDNGSGVPADIEPYLFKRYLHGDGRALLSGSVGLGTAVAAAYADSFGGTIEYLRHNERTIFEARLPAVISDTVPALV